MLWYCTHEFKFHKMYNGRLIIVGNEKNPVIKWIFELVLLHKLTDARFGGSFLTGGVTIALFSCNCVCISLTPDDQPSICPGRCFVSKSSYKSMLIVVDVVEICFWWSEYSRFSFCEWWKLKMQIFFEDCSDAAMMNAKNYDWYTNVLVSYCQVIALQRRFINRIDDRR